MRDENGKPITKRARYACERCRSRKQRCDGDGSGGKCSKCERAGVECIIPELHAEQYSKALEEKVRVLEARIQELSNARVGDKRPAEEMSSSPSSLEGSHTATTASNAGDYFGASRGEISNNLVNGQRPAASSKSKGDRNGNMEGALIKCAAFISVGSEAEPSYLGSTSGLPLASVLQRAVWDQGVPEFKEDTRDDITSPESSSKPQHAVIPPEELSLKLINTYLTKVHNRFPFLERDQLLDIHKSRLMQMSDKYSLRTRHLNRFILLMVYAIGIRLLQMAGDEDSSHLSAEAFYTAAMESFPYILGVRDHHSIQCTMLIVVYSLRSRSPADPGIWHLVGLAMRMCVELGMHRNMVCKTPADAFPVQMRRRIFWSVYFLERAISIALGRPYSISERDIDTPLPLDVDETCSNDPDILFTYMNDPSLVPHEYTDLSLGIHLVKLRRIDSVIQQVIYRVDRDTLPSLQEVEQLLNLSNEWRNSTPPFLSAKERNYMNLLYHKSVRFLLIPFLCDLPADHHLCKTCLQSAGAICRLSKALHQEGTFDHSFIALQSLFMSGLTVIYGLWTEKHKWNYRISDELRSCSTVLFVVAERSPEARQYRDVFESLLAKTTQHLVELEEEDRSSAAYLNPVESNTRGVEDAAVEEATVISGSVLPEEFQVSRQWDKMLIDDLWQLVYDTSHPNTPGNKEFDFGSLINDNWLDFAGF